MLSLAAQEVVMLTTADAVVIFATSSTSCDEYFVNMMTLRFIEVIAPKHCIGTIMRI